MCKIHFLQTAAVLLTIAAAPAHADLLTNGNFSSGNTGFTTDYPFVATDHTVSTTPPAAALITDPSAAFKNGYNSYGDHTADGPALMLFVDGQANTKVWGQSVTLAANTSYTFSYWATGADLENQAQLQFLVDGDAKDQGNFLTTAGSWLQYSDTFTTGAGGSADLSIIDLNNIAEGNDFTIDDLNLVANVSTTPVPEPGTLSLFAAGLVGAGALRRRKARKTV